MNLYHCMIDLKNDAKAIVFAAALERWMDHLVSQGLVLRWRLFRRKLNLASGRHRDFVLEIEVEGLAALDAIFSHACSRSEDVADLYEKVHGMIDAVDYGLYRPFPDPERVERVAIL
ncbi:DUF6614 family protein [Psychromarinibacter sp. S121]|uniref:DUF6614 family protein n=1 Tax=Psychromarinibacter sp. S121 TaxID=3415127 RepID=UPI003C7AE0A0